MHDPQGRPNRDAEDIRSSRIITREVLECLERHGEAAAARAEAESANEERKGRRPLAAILIRCLRRWDAERRVEHAWAKPTASVEEPGISDKGLDTPAGFFINLDCRRAMSTPLRSRLFWVARLGCATWVGSFLWHTHAVAEWTGLKLVFT